MNDEENKKIECLAGVCYTTYCEAVGGVAFNGDPLPNWDEFSIDEKKAKQANAWRAVAKACLDTLVGG